LRLSENRVQRTIFGPKKEKVVECWRKIHNEELRNSYSSPNVITVVKWRMRLLEQVVCMGWMRNAYILLGKREQTIPFLISV
jgi:hypothetical protein